jgi:hypothetical protein
MLGSNYDIKYRIIKINNYYKLIKYTELSHTKWKQTLACSINQEWLMKKAKQLIRITT